MTEEEKKAKLIECWAGLFGFTPDEIEKLKVSLNAEEVTISLLFDYKNCLYNAHSELMRCAVHPMTESCEGRWLNQIN